jgi:hypothetical protein
VIAQGPSFVSFAKGIHEQLPFLSRRRLNAQGVIAKPFPALAAEGTTATGHHRNSFTPFYCGSALL